MHLASNLLFGVGFFKARLRGLNERTALIILVHKDALVLRSIDIQLRVEVIVKGSLWP